LVEADTGALEARIGIQFSDQELLLEALTHSSYSNENPEHDIPPNERLEFLGDAILDYMTADYLFRTFSEMHEGEMTALRAALVKTAALASLAREWGLGSYLFLGRGEEASGGRNRPANLCAAFEALVGAIYLDKGMDMVHALIEPMVARQVTRLLSDRPGRIQTERFMVKDAKSHLQELSQSYFHLTPSYQTIDERGPDHEKEFTVEVLIGSVARGRGVGRSKQAAEQGAARQALQWLLNAGSNAESVE
jgi:ribonuclease-3